MKDCDSCKHTRETCPAGETIVISPCAYWTRRAGHNMAERCTFRFPHTLHDTIDNMLEEIGAGDRSLLFVKIEIDKVKGSPTDYIQDRFLDGGLKECLCHGMPFEKCPNEEE